MTELGDHLKISYLAYTLEGNFTLSLINPGIDLELILYKAFISTVIGANRLEKQLAKKQQMQPM